MVSRKSRSKSGPYLHRFQGSTNWLDLTHDDVLDRMTHVRDNFRAAFPTLPKGVMGAKVDFFFEADPELAGEQHRRQTVSSHFKVSDGKLENSRTSSGRDSEPTPKRRRTEPEDWENPEFVDEAFRAALLKDECT